MAKKTRRAPQPPATEGVQTQSETSRAQASAATEVEREPFIKMRLKAGKSAFIPNPNGTGVLQVEPGTVVGLTQAQAENWADMFEPVR